MASKQPDLSEFFKYSRPKKKPCPVAVAKQLLDDDDVAKLDAALKNELGLITTSAVREWLKARGHVVTDASVSVHRRGVCSCGNA